MDKEDYTFATTTAADGPQPYGVSEYCGWHDGSNYYEWTDFKINLTETGFRVHDAVRQRWNLVVQDKFVVKTTCDTGNKDDRDWTPPRL